MANAARRLGLMTLAGFLLAKAAFCAGQSPSLVHLVKGRGVPMCEAYLQELDRTVGDAPVSLICRHNDEFRSPAFHHAPPGPHLELTVTDRLESNAQGRLMRQIIDFTWKHDANPAAYADAAALDVWRGSPAQLKESRRAFDTYFSSYEERNEGGYSTVFADIDNDGTPEPVLYFPICAGGGPTMAAPLVLTRGQAMWTPTTTLLSTNSQSGSDTAALGGDLAYRYGRFGSLSDISFTPAAVILAASTFGTAAQALLSLGSLQDSSPRLS